MTSWNRRLSASQRQRPTVSREETLREARAAGVTPDTQAALLALAKLAADRPGFRTTLVVETPDGAEPETLTEVRSTEDGPQVRLLGSGDVGSLPVRTTPSPPPETRSEPAAVEGPDIVEVLRNTLVETPDLVAVFASVGHEALWANDAFVTMVPIRETDKIWLVELLDQWSQGHYEVKVLPSLVKYGRWRGRLTLVPGGDEPVPVSAVIVAHRDHQGEIQAVSLVARELTELAAHAEPAESSASRFEALVEHATDVIAVVDADGVIQYASPATYRVLGHGEGELTGMRIAELIHPDDAPESLADLVKPDEQGIGSPVEMRMLAADGSLRYLEVVAADLSANPAIGGLVLNARDITDRVEASQMAAAQAFTDHLTGLANRMRFLDRLSRSLNDPAGEGVLAVLLVDLDQFRALNEGYGKAFGDEALRAVGARMVDAAGEGATVARLRSDEFGVLVPRVEDRGDGVRVANALRAAIREPVNLGGVTLEIRCSIGLAFNRAGQEPEHLLRDADHAMCLAKDAGGDRSKVFSDALAARTTRRRQVEQRLRQVIDDEGLVVHFQPIVDISSGRTVAAEALLRVQDAGGTLLSPAEFVEAAESSGLITRLGSQVLQITAQQLARWVDLPIAPSEVSVNVSPRQLADREFPQRVLAALDAADIGPERLALEITESILIGHQATVDASISRLRSMGVKIGLDEFGVGHSSLGYLKRFPLDFVKIDRTIVAGLGVSDEDTAIARATIELAHNLGLVVIAVGVERENQLDMLSLLECDRAQGYLFAPPLPASELLTRPARA